MRALRVLLFVILLLLLGMVGCTPRDMARDTDTTPNANWQRVDVEDVQVQVGVGSPIPVDVVIAATWPDLCAQLTRIDQEVSGQRVSITLLATEADADCAPGPAGAPPVRITVPLNGLALEPGEYTVVVNGVEAGFAWPAP